MTRQRTSRKPANVVSYVRAGRSSEHLSLGQNRCSPTVEPRLPRRRPSACHGSVIGSICQQTRVGPRLRLIAEAAVTRRKPGGNRDVIANEIKGL